MTISKLEQYRYFKSTSQSLMSAFKLIPDYHEDPDLKECTKEMESIKQRLQELRTDLFRFAVTVDNLSCDIEDEIEDLLDPPTLIK